MSTSKNGSESAPTPTTTTTTTRIPERRNPTNPTPLSAPQEQQVRDLYYKNVREKCAAEIKAFAECAHGRTITIAFKCRPTKHAMNKCMLQYQGQTELDAARAEWFQLAGERRRAKEQHAADLADARRKHKEWWNLDENGKLTGRAEGPPGGPPGGPPEGRV